MNFISAPFAAFLRLLSANLGSYGLAILVFGLVVKLIMLPFQMKSKHSMMRTTMLQPRMKELERKYATNKQKYQEEVTKLYKEAKVNPASGCLWTLIPFPILIVLYQVVRQPLSKLMALAAEEVTAVTDVLVRLGLYTIPAKADAYAEMSIANVLSENFQRVVSELGATDFVSKLQNINFTFMGLNLTDRPRLMFWNFIDEYGTYAAVALFLLPFISAGLTVLQTKLTQAMSPAQDEKAAQTAKSMNMMMPLMSVYICFIMPAAMGVYWIEQSLLGIIQEAILNRYYKGKIAKETAEFDAEQRAKEAELERKRQETERLKAEGKTQVNANTSKKRLAAQEREQEAKRLAAVRAAERAAKGLNREIPASQVDNRRYARGRAYLADRYDMTDSEVQEAEAVLEADNEAADQVIAAEAAELAAIGAAAAGETAEPVVEDGSAENEE